MEPGDQKLLEAAAASLVSRTVKRQSRNLAGHAGAVQFEDLAHRALVQTFGSRVYRHYEFLNNVFRANPEVVPAGREALLGHPAVAHLLSRGERASTEWTKEAPFEMKQNDTAESILVPAGTASLRGMVHDPILLDVKSQDKTKNGQPPNIISAKKLVDAFCAALHSPPFELPFEIVYIAVKWEASKTCIVCRESKVVHLFKVPPDDIYINWAAATQIQFSPFEVSQAFAGTPASWALAFMRTYCDQIRKRAAKQINDATRIEKLLDGAGAP